METWCSIEGFPGYEISNSGRVYSHLSGKILKQGTHRDGYIVHRLMQNKKLRTVFVHRLVAIAFKPNPLRLPEVDHIDGNKTNARSSNLEWVTKSENMKRAFGLGLASSPDNAGVKNGQAKLKDEDIFAIRKMRLSGMTQQAIADHFDISRRVIGMILNGQRWTHV